MNQVYFLDFLLLYVMTYVHFVATCHFLFYTILMNSRLCVQLFLTWVISLLETLSGRLNTLIFSVYWVVEVTEYLYKLPEFLRCARSDAFINFVIWCDVMIIMGFSLCTWSFSLILKLSILSCGFQQWEGGLQHFLPVVLISSLSSCSMEEPAWDYTFTS